MQAAIVENGVVVNVIEVDSLDVLPGLIDGEGVAIGDGWDGAVFSRPAPPPPAVPESVPMLNLQLILIEDAKLAAVQTILDSMTGAEGARAQAYWSKALTARRDNYLVASLWPAIGYDEAGFNAAWLRAAALNP